MHGNWIKCGDVLCMNLLGMRRVIFMIFSTESVKSMTLEHSSQMILLFICKCRLLITFSNSLDSDQARQNVGPDLDQSC